MPVCLPIPKFWDRETWLADKLMSGASATTNMSQRISRTPVNFPAPVTFNMSQLVRRNAANDALAIAGRSVKHGRVEFSIT
jgi:hypothetical protein